MIKKRIKAITMFPPEYQMRAYYYNDHLNELFSLPIYGLVVKYSDPQDHQFDESPNYDDLMPIMIHDNLIEAEDLEDTQNFIGIAGIRDLQVKTPEVYFKGDIDRYLRKIKK